RGHGGAGRKVGERVAVQQLVTNVRERQNAATEDLPPAARADPAVDGDPRPRAADQILSAGKDDAQGLVGNAWLVMVGSRGNSRLACPQFVHFKTVLYRTGNSYLGKSRRSNEHASDHGRDESFLVHGYLLGRK